MNEKKEMPNIEFLRYACRAFFSHKWQLDILYAIFESPKHFGELLRSNPGISKKMLSSNLKKLETRGVIKRTPYTDGAIIRVEYTLTDEGQKLKTILKSLAEWGMENHSHFQNNNQD